MRGEEIDHLEQWHVEQRVFPRFRPLSSTLSGNESVKPCAYVAADKRLLRNIAVLKSPGDGQVLDIGPRGYAMSSEKLLGAEGIIQAQGKETLD